MAGDRGVAGVDVQVVGRGEIGVGMVADVGRDRGSSGAEADLAQVDGLEDVARFVGDVVDGLADLGPVGCRIGGGVGLIGHAGVLELGGLRDIGVVPAGAGGDLRFLDLVRGDGVELAVAAVDLDAVGHALLGDGTGIGELAGVGVLVAAALVEVGDGHRAGGVGHFDLAEPAELSWPARRRGLGSTRTWSCCDCPVRRRRSEWKPSGPGSPADVCRCDPCCRTGWRVCMRPRPNRPRPR